MTSKWTVSRAAPWQTESTRMTCTGSLRRRLHFCSGLWHNDDLNIHRQILDLKRGPQAVLVYLWVWLLSSSTSPFMGWYYLLYVQLYEPRMPEMELWHIACRGCFIAKSKNIMDFFFSLWIFHRHIQSKVHFYGKGLSFAHFTFETTGLLGVNQHRQYHFFFSFLLLLNVQTAATALTLFHVVIIPALRPGCWKKRGHVISSRLPQHLWEITLV